MSFKKRRNTQKKNLVWIFFSLVLPISTIPLFFFVFYITINIYDELENQSVKFYSNLLRQVSGNRDFLFKQDFYKDIDELKLGTLYIVDPSVKILSKSYPSPDKDYYTYDKEQKKYILEPGQNTFDTVRGMFYDDFALLNTDPLILENQDVQTVLNNFSPGSDLSQEEKENIFWKKYITKFGGLKYLTVYWYSERSKNIYIYFYPVKQIYKPINQVIKKVVFVIVAIILILSCVIFILGQIFTKPIVKRTTQLEKDKEAVEKINREKTSFFINLAHETKTPLALITIYLDKYIRNNGLSPDLLVIKQNVEKLQTDMVNFLDSEKLERGQIFFNHNQYFDFSTKLNKKIVLFREMAAAKQITIETEIENAVIGKADPAAIDRIINNLIENAVKYTQKEGNIKVNLRTDKSSILFAVQDNGPGIPEDDQKHIFLPFHQLSHKKRNIQGIGMGLYIVSRIIHSLSGSITLKSSKNGGSLFSITLPLHNVPSRTVLAENSIAGPGPRGLFSENGLPFTGSLPIDASEIKDSDFDREKSTILLVEDNPTMLSCLKEELVSEYNILTAENGARALEKLSDCPKPDLIISDIMMDKMDGYDFYIHVQNDDRLLDIPFIFLTAKTSMEEKLKGLSQGALDYLYKPFQIDELKQKIKSIVKNRKIQQHLYEKDKYASLGMLFGGISHQIFNPLSGISGPLDNLELIISDSDIENKNQAVRFLHMIGKNVNKIKDIVIGLKWLYYEKKIDKQEIKIYPLVVETAQMFKEQTGGRIQVSIEMDSESTLPANHNALGYILTNLFSNSVDSISGQGEISIKLENKNNQKVLFFKDSGCGIDKNDLDHIFNPFFTNKEIGKGTGFGLYIVKDLVLKMDWSIDVFSEKNKGTLFSITIH